MPALPAHDVPSMSLAPCASLTSESLSQKGDSNKAGGGDLASAPPAYTRINVNGTVVDVGRVRAEPSSLLQPAPTSTPAATQPGSTSGTSSTACSIGVMGSAPVPKQAAGGAAGKLPAVVQAAARGGGADGGPLLGIGSAGGGGVSSGIVTGGSSTSSIGSSSGGGMLGLHDLFELHPEVR